MGQDRRSQDLRKDGACLVAVAPWCAEKGLEIYGIYGLSMQCVLRRCSEHAGVMVRPAELGYCGQWLNMACQILPDCQFNIFEPGLDGRLLGLRIRSLRRKALKALSCYRW